MKVCIETCNEGQERAKGKASGSSKYPINTLGEPVNADQPRNKQSHIHDPGGPPSRSSMSTTDEGNEEAVGQLPSTVDLAKSFLQAEPKEKKEEIEAAVTKSQYFDKSRVNNDDGNESPTVGVGNQISLPAFLADFLEGVGDRVQIKIKDVEVDLMLKVDRPSEISSGSNNSTRSENVTIRLGIEELYVSGTISSHHDSEGSESNEAAENVTHKTRRITLSNLEVMLISEASLFASFARSTGPSSPETTHSSPVVRSHRSTYPSSASKVLSEIDADSSNGSPKATSTATKPQGLEMPPLHGASGELRDAHLPQNQKRQPLSDRLRDIERRYPDSLMAASLHSDEWPRTDELESLQDPEPFASDLAYSNSVSQTERNQQSAEPVYGHEKSKFGGDETPQPSIDLDATALTHSKIAKPSNRVKPQYQHNLGVESPNDTIAPAPEISPMLSNRSSPASEDLTQSKIFTHEEASMYMSAVSHPSCENTNPIPTVPGDWDFSGSDSQKDPEIANPAKNSSSLYGRSLSPVRTLSTSMSGFGIDLVRERQQEHHSETSESQIPRDRNASSMRSDTPELTAPKSFITPDAEAHASSQGSGVSSTDLKSSFTMIKRIASVNSIVLVMTKSTASEVNAETKRYDSEPRLPGEFVHASGLESETSYGDISKSLELGPNHRPHQPFLIEVGNVQILGDMALTRMMILIIQQLTVLCKPRYTTSEARSNPTNTPKENSQIRLEIHHIGWKFLDVVKGTPSMNTFQGQPRSTIFSQDAEILLRAEVKNVKTHYSRTSSAGNIKLSAAKFSFGYSSDHIISFDASRRLRQSTRNTPTTAESDVNLTIDYDERATDIRLTTLPLHVVIDLRRLDETFSWLGGLSSMLDLGSSMVSTITIADRNSKVSRSGKPTRGVHFESPSPSRTAQSSSIASRNKVTARLEGVILDLHGTNSSLQLESTAVKLVSREEGLGLQVDRVTLDGPHPKDSVLDPSLRVKCTNFRIEYLSTPKEIDLTRLLALLSPSKDKNARDDDILLDTLLRQRSQGGVVRATVEKLEGNVSQLDDLQCFPALIEDLKKLSTVAKYLPEDDRPGLLILGLIKSLEVGITINSSFGTATLACQNMEFAHVSFPSLIAIGIESVQARRNHSEELIGSALPSGFGSRSPLPMVMARFIGNEMEPTAKIKLNNLRLEYHVSTVIAIMGFSDNLSNDTMVAEIANSVATITTRHAPKLSKQSTARSDTSISSSKALKFDVVLRDLIMGLNPRNSAAKGLLVLTEASFLSTMPRENQISALFEITKASIMVVDDFNGVTTADQLATSSVIQRSQTESLCDMGYVSVSLISAAKASVQAVSADEELIRSIDVEIRDELFVLETCADSTHTLQEILNGLKPPTPPSTDLKYRTEVVPVEDMLASLTGDAFATTEPKTEVDETPLGLDEGDMVDDEVPQNLEFVSSFYNPDPDAAYDGIVDSMLDDDLESLASPSMVREIGDKNLLESFQDQTQIAPGNVSLDFREDHFGASSMVAPTARAQNTQQSSYGINNEYQLRNSPLRVRVRDVHIIWNLFDGYDWQHTRDVISQAVEDVQAKASERSSRKDKRKSFDPEEEDESVIGDFLFNSIYIGIPVNRDPKDLARHVNRNIDDLVSESESYATSTSSGSPNRHGQKPRSKGKTLRLKRSQSHKMTFELKGISADVVVFPPDTGEIQSSIDVRIQDLEIFDHVPTSTWKKFATYMHDAGERESGTSMIHLEMLNVKPVPSLAASEIILKVSQRFSNIYRPKLISI